jgi:hypothetical protein
MPVWEVYTAKPGSAVAEAQGGFIGTDLFLFGGFDGGWNKATNKSYYMNTVTQNWTEVDPIPIPKGVTHMGNVIVGNKVYGCGGYTGGVSGGLPATAVCFVYTHGNPSGTQWTALPNLPFLRSGGAMFYDKIRNSIYYATGADLHDIPQPPRPVDWQTVWELNLDNIGAGWISRANLPYRANHAGGTTVSYHGIERHFVLGGQDGPNEAYGNYNLLFEYNAVTDIWTQRANMSVPAGHVSSSTVAYKDCGFFIMGGANNCKCKTSAIYYYDIGSNNWTLIGNLPQAVNTPVCGVLDDWIYCQSGVAFSKNSWRRKIG